MASRSKLSLFLSQQVLENRKVIPCIQRHFGVGGGETQRGVCCRVESETEREREREREENLWR